MAALPRPRILGSQLGRLFAAIVSGALLACSFPKPSLWFLAFVAFVPLLLALPHARSKWQAFAIGEAMMTTFWLLVVPWVINVMAYYGGLGTPTGIVIFIAMSLFLGLWGGFFAIAFFVVQRRFGVRALALTPLLWAASEYGRTYLNSGFPWTLAGEAFIGALPLAMLASLAGPYLLSALAVTISALIAYQFTAVTKQQRLIALAAAAVTLLVWFSAGWLLLTMRDRQSVNPSRTAALLQPNITQEMRWNSEDLLTIFQRMMQMTDSAAAGNVDAVIWPESTVPLTYLRTDFYRDYIESVSRDRNVDIILGSVAEDPKDETKIWNAAYLVSGGQTKGRYDKIRLVPYGEYVPLRKMLFFAKKLVRQVGEFQFGANEHPLQGKHRYGPAICYEVVFPQITATQVRHGADVIVTITNDAWFGRSAAPYQHLDMVRMRAIESDRWVLRSATTGISAVVAPSGRVIEQLPLGAEGVIRAKFSPRQSLTPYVRFGDWFAWLAVIVTFISLVIRRKAPIHE